jgi:hypothetical protein
VKVWNAFGGLFQWIASPPGLILYCSRLCRLRFCFQGPFLLPMPGRWTLGMTELPYPLYLLTSFAVGDIEQSQAVVKEGIPYRKSKQCDGLHRERLGLGPCSESCCSLPIGRLR